MNDIYGYLIALGALIAGVVAAYFKGKSAAKNEQVKHDYNAVQKAKGFGGQVDKMGDDDVRNTANKWVRGKKR